MRIVALAVVLTAASAHAGPRCVLVGGDPVLEHAVEVALGPWQLELRTASGSVADLQAAARLAQAQQAAAVVWIAPDGYLWIYDADSAQAVTRHVDVPLPLDASAAAALALSVKTLLRSTTVAPPAERVGATVRLREELRLEAHLGAQILFGTPQTAEWRVGLQLAWYPRRAQRWFGLALRIEAGAASIDRGGFSGTLTDVTLALAPRLHIPLGRRLELEPSVGVGLHITQLDGGLPTLGLRAHEVHPDASLEAGIALDAHLGHSVRLGLIATLAYLFQYQRYTVNAAPVVELFPVQLDLALRLAVGVL